MKKTSLIWSDINLRSNSWVLSSSLQNIQIAPFFDSKYLLFPFRTHSETMNALRILARFIQDVRPSLCLFLSRITQHIYTRAYKPIHTMSKIGSHIPLLERSKTLHSLSLVTTEFVCCC
jgi:hypothetical protein